MRCNPPRGAEPLDSSACASEATHGREEPVAERGPLGTRAIELFGKEDAVAWGGRIKITGKVSRRPAGNENPDLPTGEIEVVADALEVLSEAAPLPFPVEGAQELSEEIVGECGLSSIGAVVGATYPRAIGEARRLLPQAILLLPGVGAQGATPADIARAFTSGPASALVTASRSVIYAFRDGDEDWRAPAAAEAARLSHEVWTVSGW